MTPQTHPDAIIVAHGQPSDPSGPEAEIVALAARVGALTPGAQVRGATLATPGALEAALNGLQEPVIFPFFMSDGWFTRDNLPERLARAGHQGLRILPPFGLLPGANHLALRMLIDALNEAGWDEAETTLILAAHGSGRSAQPAERARETASSLAQMAHFATIRLGFIEEDPRLAEALSGAGEKALCLPLFVARWGHIREDLPKAVAASGFQGRVLEPIGLHETVPQLIADALRA